MKTVDKAKLVIEALKHKSSVQDIKKQICNDNADWDSPERVLLCVSMDTKHTSSGDQ